MDPNAYWIISNDMGIRAFCRAGSTTLLTVFARNQNREKWITQTHKFIVVRNPWERLLSAWAMFLPKEGRDMETRGYPSCECLDNLLDFISTSPQSTLDLHTRSMHSQLEGMEVKEAMLVSLPWLLQNLPEGESQRNTSAHLHKTIVRPSPQCSEESFRRWRATYDEDWKMWGTAKKLPAETGRKGSDAR